jgi:hypothetical protein
LSPAAIQPMSEVLSAFVIWLRATAISQTVAAQAEWLWAIAESLHFFGLALVIGCAGVFDLRLMGFMRRHVSIDAVHGYITWAKVGFAISLVSGAIFFISEPQQYVVKSAWWWKVGFLVLAGANALVYETQFSRRLGALPPHDEPPLALKALGLVSLVSWFAVLYFGRMLPYLEPGLNSNL